METPLYTTEERFTFIRNRIRERRQFVEQVRGQIKDGNLDRRTVENFEHQVEQAELQAETQENALRVLFPERF